MNGKFKITKSKANEILERSLIDYDIEAAELALQSGANPNLLQKSSNGNAILSDAAGMGRTEICKLLIKYGADIDFQPDNSSMFGNNALSRAVAFNRLDICKLLLEAGANADIKDSSGETPLFSIALTTNSPVNLEILKLFTAYGAHLDVVNYHRHSLLHIYAERGNKDACRYLVESIPDLQIDAKDDLGRTPLYLAVFAMLLDSPANPKKNPLMDVCKYLITVGADPETKDNHNCNPLEVKIIGTDGHSVDTDNYMEELKRFVSLQKTAKASETKSQEKSNFEWEI